MKTVVKHFLAAIILFTSSATLIAQTLTSIPDDIRQSGSLAVNITGQNVNFLQGSSTTLTSIDPNNARQGENLIVTITGQNTNFLQGSSTVTSVWFLQGSSTINASSFWGNSNTSLSANFNIPSGASTGSYDVKVADPVDGILTLPNGFTVNTPKVYVLSVGVRVPGDIIVDDVQAERVRDAFAKLPGVSHAELLILQADNSWNRDILENAINLASTQISNGGIFIMYIGAHGFYDEGVDEPSVWVQCDPYHTDWRIPNEGDEHFYLSEIDKNDNISDDDFSALFTSPHWSNINKLFIIDTCFAGGFWGTVNGIDSGDLGRLTRASLIPAASEADFAGTVPYALSNYRVGKLGKALEDALEVLPCSYTFASLDDLVDVIRFYGYQYIGSVGPIKSFTDNWGIPIATDFNIQPKSTADFVFSLQVRASTLQGDLDDDGNVDFADFYILSRHWLSQNCYYPDWCEGADLNHSGSVNFIDFALFAEHWLEVVTPIPGDITGDGKVDLNDLKILAEQWLHFGILSADIAPPPSGDGIVNFQDFAVFASHWLEGTTP